MDIDEAWGEVQRAIDDAELAVFPMLPDLKRMPSVAWPDDVATGFIALLTQLRPPLVYVLLEQFGEESITDERPLIAAAGVAGDALLATARSHFGELCNVTVGFMEGGVFHLWNITSPWYDDFFVDVERLQDVADELELQRHSESRGQHLQALAHHPSFAKAKNEVERTALASTVVPGWDAWPRHDVSTFIWEAKALFDAEVLPGIEEDLARQGWAHIRSGASKPEAARRVGIGDERMRRLLARFPDDGSEPSSLFT